MSRRPYVRPLPRATWYLSQPRYRTYMLRELTSLIVAAYCALLIAALLALGSGEADRWAAFLASQRHPGWMVFHGFSLVFYWTFQTAPWFQLAPRAMALPTRRFPAAPRFVIAAHYLAWLVVSGIVLRMAGVI